MNQNDLVALGLSVLVIGGLAVFGPKLGEQRRLLPPTPNPNERPTPPGSDPQYEAARRTIEALGVALQAQGGGTQAQREQMAQVLDAQAATPGQSPAAAALLRQAAQQLRSGQLPNVPPAPNPAPAPTPRPPTDVNALLAQAAQFTAFAAANPTQARAEDADALGQALLAAGRPIEAQAMFALAAQLRGRPAPGGAAPVPPAASPPSADVLRARDAIRRVESDLEKIYSAAVPPPPFPIAQSRGGDLEATIVNYQDPAAIAMIRTAVARLRSGIRSGLMPATGQVTPSASSAGDLMARYTELRDHLADFLQGARAIDAATLGAADRTSTDLQRAGDMNHAADLGALATASYARAGIARPVPVQA